MNYFSTVTEKHLLDGERLPNFVRLDRYGQGQMLYDICCGEGALLVILTRDQVDTCAAALNRLIFNIHQRRLKPIIICPCPVDELQDKVDFIKDEWIVLADTDHALFRHFTGHEKPEDLRSPRMIATDTTLRINYEGDMMPLDMALEQTFKPSMFTNRPTVPVLVVPRALTNQECDSLISGFANAETSNSVSHMEQDGEIQMQVRPEFKVRQDMHLDCPETSMRLMALISRRVGPELKQIYNFVPQTMEKMKVCCYDAKDGGHFAVHRDNTTPDAAQRKFAMTINLNTGEYEGGHLIFPEYSTDPVYIPRGAAVIFSCAMAHQVTSVSRGQRYALISFFS